MDSTSTTIVEIRLADSELISGGHGLAPVAPPKKFAYPWNVSGAKNDGGLVAASVSLCNEVSSIQSTGATNSSPTTHATRPSIGPAMLRFLGAIGTASADDRRTSGESVIAVIGSPPGTATTRSAARTSR